MKRTKSHTISYTFEQREILDLISKHTDAVVPPRGEDEYLEVSGLGILITVSVTYPETAPSDGVAKSE